MKSILEQKESTHGEFKKTSQIFNNLLAVLGPSPNGILTMPYCMILVKLARMSSGDFNEEDHWRDIAGYAEGALEVLRESKPVEPYVLPD